MLKKTLSKTARQKWMECYEKGDIVLSGISTRTVPGNPPYEIIYNPNRAKRPGLTNIVECKAPEGCRYDKGMKQGEVLVPEKFGEFNLCYNKFAIEPYHCLLIHKDPGQSQNNVAKDDLDHVVSASGCLGMRAFHNCIPQGDMPGTAATIDHLHYHLMDRVFHIEYTDIASFMVPIPDAYHMLTYPGANVIFQGYKAPERTAKLVKALGNNGIAHTVGIVSDAIYIFPRKKETPEKIQQKAGGLEIAGNCFVVCDKQNEDGSIDKIGEQLFNSLTYKDLRDAQAETVYSEKELKGKGFDWYGRIDEIARGKQYGA